MTDTGSREAFRQSVDTLVGVGGEMVQARVSFCTTVWNVRHSYHLWGLTHPPAWVRGRWEGEPCRDLWLSGIGASRPVRYQDPVTGELWRGMSLFGSRTAVGSWLRFWSQRCPLTLLDQFSLSCQAATGSDTGRGVW